MFRMLQARMGRLGVVMTFLAVLFATAPILEAAACAAEGCSIACLQELDANPAVASDDADPSSEGCTDQGCICAVGHCHVCSVPVPIEATRAPMAIDLGSRVESEQLVSSLPQLLERPPRD